MLGHKKQDNKLTNLSVQKLFQASFLTPSHEIRNQPEKENEGKKKQQKTKQNKKPNMTYVCRQTERHIPGVGGRGPSC